MIFPSFKEFSTSGSESVVFPVPLPLEAQQIAQQTVKQLQPKADPKLNEQVRLNVLALFAVKSYLNFLGINAYLDLNLPPIEITNLTIPHIGKLECRPVRSGDSTVYIPMAAWSDRIGYVAVQISDSDREGMLLGFIEPTLTEIVSLERIQPLDLLLQHIHNLQTNPETGIVALRSWFQKTIEGLTIETQMLWKSVEAIEAEISDLLEYRSVNPVFRSSDINSLDNLVPDPDGSDTVSALLDLLPHLHKHSLIHALYLLENLAIGNPTAAATLTELLQNPDTDEEVRQAASVTLGSIAPGNPLAGVRRARVVQLDAQLHRHTLTLIATLTPEPENKMGIHFRLRPIESPTLPADLTLSILDQDGNVFLTATGEEEDDFIQLEFSAEIGDYFSVQVSLDNATITEQFVV